MQKDLSKIKKDIHIWIKRNKEITDVILFGSYIRSKDKFNDIDVAIIVNESHEKKILDFIDSLYDYLKKYSLKFHISAITEKDFINGSEPFVKNLVGEGYSILKDRNLSFLWGYEPKSIFTYNLKNFNSSKRVRFHYLLKGRKSRGILKEVSGELIGDGVIIVSKSKEEILKEIFEKWGINFKIKTVLFEK